MDYVRGIGFSSVCIDEEEVVMGRLREEKIINLVQDSNGVYVQSNEVMIPQKNEVQIKDKMNNDLDDFLEAVEHGRKAMKKILKAFGG